MALNGNFVSFYSVVERIYRDAGYQQVDWTDAIEYIADALRLIGAKDAFKITSTNGLTFGSVTNPSPLEITDYRASLPAGYINYIAARKVQIADDGTIADFFPMVYTTDLFDQTPIRKVLEDVDAGTYTALDWTVDGDGYILQPVIVNSMRSISYNDYIYTYRINNSMIETNFETGYVEMVYLSYVTDDHGFPMVPDDIKMIKAVTAYITERLDYKLWRKGLIPDKVYRKSEQECSWYISAADSKASIPSIDKMESIKNMILHTNPRINRHDVGFKYNNLPERRNI